MAEQGRLDPLLGMKFRVLIPGADEVQFASCTGLTEESEVVEYREGTDPITVRKIPGLLSYEDITLERGVTTSMRLIEWRRQVAGVGAGGAYDGAPPPNFRRAVTIQVFDKGSEEPKRTFEIHQAWPRALEHGDLDATASDIFIERLVLAHEGIEIKGG